MQDTYVHTSLRPLAGGSVSLIVGPDGVTAAPQDSRPSQQTATTSLHRGPYLTPKASVRTHFKHRFPAPTSRRKDVVNQCLESAVRTAPGKAGGGAGGTGIVQLVERPPEKARRNTDASSSPRCGKGFFSQSQLPVQTLLRCPYSPLCAIAFIDFCAHVKNPKAWQPYHCLDTRKYCTH